MALWRSVALLARPLFLAAALALLMPSASAQNCPDKFTVTGATVGGYGDTVQVEVDVEETTPSTDELYTLSWDTDCVDAPQITDDNFNKYFTINDTTACTWVVSVNEALIGLPDYPSPQDAIETVVEFTGFTDIASCYVTLLHNIKDANTQAPQSGQLEYTLVIKEDFSPGYTIGDFATMVQDKDGTSPNNKFFVNVDEICPLEASQQTYTSGEVAVAVQYQLSQALDYEATPAIMCSVEFHDMGSPTLTSTTTINIVVVDVSNKPPVFSQDFYYTDVLSVVASNDPLLVMPSEISAVDGDIHINETITYSMANAQPDVNGSAYFAINENTGQVTHTQDLDDDFLLNERVIFFVTATEDSGARAHAVLEVRLPWRNLVCGGLHFEQAVYVAEIFPLSEGHVLRVLAVTTAAEEPHYSLSELTGECGLSFFIEPSTGWIMINQCNPPSVGLHELQAVATTSFSSQQTTATVTINVKPLSAGEAINKAKPLLSDEVIINVTPHPSHEVVINVKPLSPDEVVIPTSIIRSAATEGEELQDLGSVNLSASARSVCIKGADPPHMKERFALEKESDKNWRLKKVGALDRRETPEVTLVIEAFQQEVECSSLENAVPTSLLRSQALAIISVHDAREVQPTTEGRRSEVGHGSSTQRHLQRAEDRQGMHFQRGQDAAQSTVNED